jgi:hypothetical protein
MILQYIKRVVTVITINLQALSRKKTNNTEMPWSPLPAPLLLQFQQRSTQRCHVISTLTETVGPGPVWVWGKGEDTIDIYRI